MLVCTPRSLVIVIEQSFSFDLIRWRHEGGVVRVMHGRMRMLLLRRWRRAVVQFVLAFVSSHDGRGRVWIDL